MPNPASEASNEELTLFSIPIDIMRMIIKSNFGEKMDSLKLISKTWKSMVFEYFKNLPPLDYVYLGFHEESEELRICLYVSEQHHMHFRKVLPNGARICEEKDEGNLSLKNRSYRLAIFRLTLGTPHSIHYIRRIFQSTNQLRLLGLDNFSKAMMEPLIETMRAVEIRNIVMIGQSDHDSRVTMKEITTRHRTSTLIIDGRRKLSLNEWRPFIQCMANSVPIIEVNVSKARPESDQNMVAWKSFAQNLLCDGVEIVKLVNACKSIIFYRQPWLEFADQFHIYLNEQFPWPRPW